MPKTRITSRPRAKTMGQLKKEPSVTEKRASFLKHLSESPNITRAAALAGLGRETVYHWRKTDEEFGAAWDAALTIGDDALEDEAIRRGQEGVERPVFQGGKQVGSIREYSDNLLMFTLKKRKPEFRDGPSAVSVIAASLEELIRLSYGKRLEGNGRIIEGEAVSREVPK